MLGSKALATLSPLRHASKRLPPATVPVKHVRFVNTDKEEAHFARADNENTKAAFVNMDGEDLSGGSGSEPPRPQRSPVNWKAGTITAVGVLLAGWWMLRSKSRRAR